jgi:hypothetical protein
MDRRGFIGMLAGGVAVGAAVRTWPFRVYSFPTDIQIAHWYDNPANFDIGMKPSGWDEDVYRRVVACTRPLWPSGNLFSDNELAQAVECNR